MPAISALPAASALAGTEVLPCVQSGATDKVTANQVKTFVVSARGSATLVGGTATVTTAAATATALIFLTVGVLGTVTVAKAVAVTSRTNGVSFVITSADATDTSTVVWATIEP